METCSYFFTPKTERMFVFGHFPIKRSILLRMTNKKIIVLREFLSNEENLKLVEQYHRTPTICVKTQLDNKFKRFYLVIRHFTYLLKTIHFKAKMFDKSIRKYHQIYPLIVDGNTNGTVFSKSKLVDEFVDQISFMTLEEYVSNPEIMKAIYDLTDKQKQILYHLYINDFSIKELAGYLGVSSQNISKIKNQALNQLRKNISIYTLKK